MFKKLLSFTLALSFLFVSTVSASAASADDFYFQITNEVAYTFAEMAEVASKSTDINDIETKNFYIDLAKNKITGHEFVVNGGKSNLNFGKVNVVTTNYAGSTFTSVNVAIAGNYSTLSNLNVMFNENNEFIGYTETLIYNNPETNKFIIDNFQNGEILEHKQTNIDYITNEQIDEGLQGLKNLSNHDTPMTRGDGTVGCLAALLGVNGVVAALIYGTCAAACAAAPITGAVCAACIGGICTIGAADIAGVIACFTLA